MILRNIASLAEFRPDKMGKSNLVRGEWIFAGLNSFEAGQEHALHTHAGQDKLYFVLEGAGVVTVGDETGPVNPGDLVLAEADVPHSLRNPGPGRLVVMAVMAPPPKPKP